MATPFTVCFAGTGCTRDEGESTRPQSDKRIYCPRTGYIPIRIHLEIAGSLRATSPSISVRGVGENDWAQPRNSSEPLRLDGPLQAAQDLRTYCKDYSGGDQYSRVDQMNGWAAAALALHGANAAAASGAQTYNLIGHSRGAVACIMAAWFLYAYGPRTIPVNIFAIDPVPGVGDWYGILTQLPPNVANYVGVYAWDHSLPTDRPFSALVPRPNGRMTNKPDPEPGTSWWSWLMGTSWKSIADDVQMADPLAEGSSPQPSGYVLYACRGRHSTVSGSSTSDGLYDPSKVSPTVAPVPKLVYRTARAYLTAWGTTFATPSAVREPAIDLRRAIHLDHREFDAMGGGVPRTSSLTSRPYVRRISSICGRLPWDTYYFEDVVGDPPYQLAFPVSTERTGKGWVAWKFL